MFKLRKEKELKLLVGFAKAFNSKMSGDGLRMVVNNFKADACQGRRDSSGVLMHPDLSFLKGALDAADLRSVIVKQLA